MRPSTKKDLNDFADMANDFPSELAQYIRRLMDEGHDPRSVSFAFQCAADNCRGWCIGRFG